jgi:hypothetical protein
MAKVTSLRWGRWKGRAVMKILTVAVLLRMMVFEGWTV